MLTLHPLIYVGLVLIGWLVGYVCERAWGSIRSHQDQYRRKRRDQLQATQDPYPPHITRLIEDLDKPLIELVLAVEQWVLGHGPTGPDLRPNRGTRGVRERAGDPVEARRAYEDELPDPVTVDWTSQPFGFIDTGRDEVRRTSWRISDGHGVVIGEHGPEYVVIRPPIDGQP